MVKTAAVLSLPLAIAGPCAAFLSLPLAIDGPCAAYLSLPLAIDGPCCCGPVFPTRLILLLLFFSPFFSSSSIGTMCRSSLRLSVPRCGSIDVTFYHFPRICQPRPTPRAPWAILRLVPVLNRVLIGAWNPML